MAKIVKPLTNMQVQQAKPKEKEYNLSDGSGLQLRVKPNGSKLWLFNYYKPYSKKRSNIGFGSLNDVSLSEARKKREHARGLLDKDIDPKEHKENTERELTLAHSNTLELVAAKWLEVKKTKVSSDHAHDIWRSFQLHIFPSLGNVPIYKLSAVKTIEILQPIAAKGSLETIKRLCQRINEVMAYAVNCGIIEQNPLLNINQAFQKPVKQNQLTLEPSELPELVNDLNNVNIRTTTRHLIFWQLHTMTRPSEAVGTRWDEIDFDNQVWLIPKERMKRRKAHTTPLTPQTLEILASMKPISGHREYVFPADRDPLTHTHRQTANATLRRMGYGERLVSHGLRALASTTLNEQGFDPDIIEAALAHSGKDQVRAAYNRAEYLERRRVMMCWWSNLVTSK
jgi:integrase